MQDGAGWGSEQSSLMEVVPAYDNKVGGPFQYKQSYNFPFYFCSWVQELICRFKIIMTKQKGFFQFCKIAVLSFTYQ